MGKKISRKIQKAAEEYLALLGSSPQQLTEKQWHLTVNFIRALRVTKPMITVFLIIGIALTYLAFLYSDWTKREIAKVVPTGTIFLHDADDKSILPLQPCEIRDYLESLSSLSFNTGPAFILAVFLFLLVIIIPLYRRAHGKILEAFIKRESIHPAE